MRTTGRLLVATPPMDDPNFERAVILVLRHDDDGAFGLVLTRPSKDFSPADDSAISMWLTHTTPPAQLFEGGPVQQNTVIGLATFHEESDRPWTDLVAFGLHTVDLESDPANGHDCLSFRLFVGYSGWGPSQLDEEIAAGFWFVVDATPHDPFDGNPDTMWRRILERDPIHREWVRQFPDDPAMN